MLKEHLESARFAIGIVAVTIVVGGSISPTSARKFDAPDRRAAQMRDAYANLPVAFVENRGQACARVRYYAKGPRYAFYLTRDEVIVSFMNAPASGGVALALQFRGANASLALEGEERAAGEVNYFRGNDAAAWRTGIPRYVQVAYRELWPGVDLRLREQTGTLKYEFRVRAGARPADIRLAYTVASGLSIDGSGALLIETGMGTLRDSPPVSHQMIDGVRVPVDSRYALVKGTADDAEYGFDVGDSYRPDHELIIDPGVEYSTFLGGSSHELGNGIKVDAAGNAYVVGTTQSPDFRTTAGAFRTTGAPGNVSDVFVSKLNATGTALVYSTFIGGDHLDDGMAIAVDGSGNAYVAGETGSTNFPTTAGAFDRTINGAFDTFVTKLNATGSALVYSTYLGGSAVEFPSRIAVDTSGNAFVVGSTSSTNFPTTAGAFDTTANGAFDVFVTKLNAAGSALVYSTYLGGQNFDSAGGLAIDAAGNAYVAGGAGSVDFPTTPGAFDTLPDGSDAFITKLNPAGSALVYSTVLGGTSSDGANAIVLDAAGNAWVTGGTSSTDFPVTVLAFDLSFNGVGDAFVSELNADGATLLYSTELGGRESEAGDDIARDSAGDIYVTGHTYSLDFPTTAGAFDTVFNGDTSIFWGDAFANKFATDTATSTPPSTPPTPAAPALVSPVTHVNPPLPITIDFTDIA